MAISPKLIVSLGVLLFILAMFQMIQFRRFVKETGSEANVPVDIYLQALVAFGLCCFGALHAFSPFKNILAAFEHKSKTMDTLNYREDFMVFLHRGQAVSNMKARD